MWRERAAGSYMRLLRPAYVLLMFVTCMSTYSLDYTPLKAGSALFVAIAAVDLCLFFRRDRLRLVADVGIQYMIYVVGLLVVSMLIYVGGTTDVPTMARGFTKIFYQLLTVLVALSAVYCFGGEAMDLTFDAFVAFNAVAMLLSLVTNHATLASDLAHFVTSGGDAVGYFRTLELSETTFSFGLIAIYYAATGMRRNAGRILACVFFFLVGFKRIAVGGLALSFLFCILMRGRTDRQLRIASGIVCRGFLVFGFLFVVSIRSGLFVAAMDGLGIDMMGRQNLYEYINRFYEISPLFPGRGFEAVTLLLRNAGDIKINDTTISRLTALHNDYLTIFVEMGFWGFLGWLAYYLVYMRRYFERFPRAAFLAYVMCSVYLCFTYMTDNTAMFYMTNILYRLVPLAIAAGAGYETGAGDAKA